MAGPCTVSSPVLRYVLEKCTCQWPLYMPLRATKRHDMRTARITRRLRSGGLAVQAWSGTISAILNRESDNSGSCNSKVAGLQLNIDGLWFGLSILNRFSAILLCCDSTHFCASRCRNSGNSRLAALMSVRSAIRGSVLLRSRLQMWSWTMVWEEGQEEDVFCACQRSREDPLSQSWLWTVHFALCPLLSTDTWVKSRRLKIAVSSWSVVDWWWDGTCLGTSYVHCLWVKNSGFSQPPVPCSLAACTNLMAVLSPQQETSNQM